MKKTLLFVLSLMFFNTVFAQQNAQIYDENRDAMLQIKEAVAQAKQDGKYVLCQVGGNWCPWCIKFAKFAETDSLTHQIIQDNFVYIHVNYSKNNKNPEAMKYLGNPARFGFPVFVILNEQGEPIHIQNSAYLEKDKGYDPQKVAEFLDAWTRKSVNTLR